MNNATLEREPVRTIHIKDTPEQLRTRRRVNKLIRRACYGATALSLTVAAVGAAGKHWFGVHTVTNPDGSSTVEFNAPDVPPTTAVTVLPPLDTSDRTELAVMMQEAIARDPWCAKNHLLQDNKAIAKDRNGGRQYMACANNLTLEISRTPPYVPSVVLELVPIDDKPASDPPSIYMSYAANTAACEAGLSDLSVSYRTSIADSAHVDPASVPDIHFIIDAGAEAVAPGMSCGTLCVPVSSNCGQTSVPTSVEGQTNGG